MIRLLPRPERPARLSGSKIGQKKAVLTRKNKRGERITKEDFDSNYYSHVDIRCPLWTWQSRKCCYCERWRDLMREPDVDHFRPKSRVDGEAGPGYWWLAYDWNNLFFSCRTCNQAFKKAAFPLEAGGVRAGPGGDLVRERPTLPDLEREDPETLIGYYWVQDPEPLAKPVGLDRAGRGDRIIAVLGLNRDELNVERGQLIGPILAQVYALRLAVLNNNHELRDQEAANVRRATSRDQSFLGFRLFLFRQHGLDAYLQHE